jgi:hypothetical protein
MTAARRPKRHPRTHIRVQRQDTVTAAARPGIPLLHLQAHWTLQAHPRYLEAAAFHWPQ